ncbi:MAG: DUF2027 domain-containing protein [Bacteroidales bacterium]|nr:DUF2027 domain-containing protein [Bacteroidales bacterium]
MKFKIGDKVKFLNDVGEGIVKKIVSESLVNVEIEDGFEVPTLVSELVKIQDGEDISQNIEFSDNENFNEKIEEEVESVFNTEVGEYIIGNDNPEIFIALIPDFKNSNFINGFDLFLINNSNYQVLYVLSKLENEKQEHIDAGILGANTKINFMYLSNKELNKELIITTQTLFYQIHLYKEIPPFIKKIHIDPFEIMDETALIENDFFETKGIIINLTDDIFIKELENISKSSVEKVIKEKDLPEPKLIKQEKPEIEEIDLHIEELVDNHAGLSNSEILEIQMSRFKIALEGALRNNIKKVVFIHGVGNGTLRYELRKHIDNRYPKCKYQDASFKEYGYGATMVYLY